MKTILCYGDSNLRGFVAGSFDEKTELSGRMPRNKRWTGILQHKLGDRYDVIEEGLNGRTTNLDEILPGRPYRNGFTHLPMMLESHFPIDLVIFNLGTNDTKVQYHRSAHDIANGMRELAVLVTTSNKGPDGTAPKVLLIAPPPMLEVALRDDSPWDQNSIQVSRNLGASYKQLAKETGCAFLDASLIVKACEVDGVHLDEHHAEILGNAVVNEVRQILR